MQQKLLASSWKQSHALSKYLATFWKLAKIVSFSNCLKKTLSINTWMRFSLLCNLTAKILKNPPENSQNTARERKVDKICQATGIFLSLEKIQSLFCAIYLFCSGCLIYCSGLATSWLGAGSVFSSSAGWGLGVVSCLKKRLINTFLPNFYLSHLVPWSYLRKGEAKSSYNLS